MAKKCYECSIKTRDNDYSYPDSAHYCGMCGHNIARQKHKWTIYNQSRYFLLPRYFLGGVISIMFGIGCFISLFIEWFFPELVGAEPHNKKGILVSVCWCIAIVLLFIIGFTACKEGYAWCFPSKKEKWD